MRAVPAAENTELVGRYVGEKCGVQFTPGAYQAFAILNDQGDFCAGVVISNFRDHDCEISCATETSAAWRDHVMRAVFTYVFKQLGCVRCTCIVRKNNKRCRDFLDGLGFVLEGNLRKAYDGVKDALIYGLLAEECRYIVDPEPAAGEPETGGNADLFGISGA